MKKKIKTYLHNKTENKFFNSEIIGIFLDNTIKYCDNEISVIIKETNEGIVIERKCLDYDISLLFIPNQTTKGVYNVKGLGLIKPDVYTNKLHLNDNQLDIEYELVFDEYSTNKFHFYLEMEDIK